MGSTAYTRNMALNSNFYIYALAMSRDLYTSTRGAFDCVACMYTCMCVSCVFTGEPYRRKFTN